MRICEYAMDTTHYAAVHRAVSHIRVFAYSHIRLFAYSLGAQRAVQIINQILDILDAD